MTAKDLTLQTTASGDTSRVPTQQGATHTKGPWKVASSRDGKEYVYGADSRPIFITNATGTKAFRSEPEQKANLRLIAQSPALLDSCKELREAAAACFRFIATHCDEGFGQALEDELAAAGVKEGFGLRAQNVIAAVEGRE